MIIYKTSTFDAAHRLKGHDHCQWTHGHSWRVEVWISGKQKPTEDLGMVVDFRTIDRIITGFDHRCMLAENDLDDDVFGTVVLPFAPSCENLVHIFLGKLTNELENWDWIKVRVWETETSYAEDEIYGEEKE